MAALGELESSSSTVRVDSDVDETRPSEGRGGSGLLLNRQGKVCIRLDWIRGIRVRASERRMVGRAKGGTSGRSQTKLGRPQIRSAHYDGRGSAVRPDSR